MKCELRWKTCGNTLDIRHDSYFYPSNLEMPAGYSGTPLLKKLGIQPHMKLLLLHAPANYFALVETDLHAQIITGQQVPDFIHLFAVSTTVFEKEMKKILPLIAKNTSLIIWVSWYKKSAKIPTDITEDTIRKYALQHQLVDVKVCAVNDQWSALKLVVPLVKR